MQDRSSSTESPEGRGDLRHRQPHPPRTARWRPRQREMHSKENVAGTPATQPVPGFGKEALSLRSSLDLFLSFAGERDFVCVLRPNTLPVLFQPPSLYGVWARTGPSASLAFRGERFSVFSLNERMSVRVEMEPRATDNLTPPCFPWLSSPTTEAGRHAGAGIRGPHRRGWAQSRVGNGNLAEFSLAQRLGWDWPALSASTSYPHVPLSVPSCSLQWLLLVSDWWWCQRRESLRERRQSRWRGMMGEK